MSMRQKVWGQGALRTRERKVKVNMCLCEEGGGSNMHKREAWWGGLCEEGMTTAQQRRPVVCMGLDK